MLRNVLLFGLVFGLAVTGQARELAMGGRVVVNGRSDSFNPRYYFEGKQVYVPLLYMAEQLSAKVVTKKGGDTTWNGVAIESVEFNSQRWTSLGVIQQLVPKATFQVSQDNYGPKCELFIDTPEAPWPDKKTSGDPRTAVTEFLTAFGAARDVKEIGPYYSDQSRKTLRDMKFDKRVNFMSRASQYRRLKLKVDKVEVTGDSCIVYASGPNDQGTTFYARFNLLREKGQWKVWRDTFGTMKGSFSNEWP